MARLLIVFHKILKIVLTLNLQYHVKKEIDSLPV